jgi:hypothetical protein
MWDRMWDWQTSLSTNVSNLLGATPSTNEATNYQPSPRGSLDAHHLLAGHSVLLDGGDMVHYPLQRVALGVHPRAFL